MFAVVPSHEVYRTHMVEFKLRLVYCEQVAFATKTVTGLPALDSEFCFLQMRRMVELIAFSSALRDEERYKSLRKIQQQQNSKDHGDHTRDWEAPEILRRLAQISPYCLPIPLKLQATKSGAIINFDRKNISVTHGRLIEIYGICGGFLHAKNPFQSDFQAHVNKERKKYEDASKEVLKCLAYFRKLMWNHAAVGLAWSPGSDPKAAEEPKTAWLVDFGVGAVPHVDITLSEAQ